MLGQSSPEHPFPSRADCRLHSNGIVCLKKIPSLLEKNVLLTEPELCCYCEGMGLEKIFKALLLGVIAFEFWLQNFLVNKL